MRYLPAIASGTSRWVFPMADRSAEMLAELVLSDDRAQRAAELADLLRGDPPLALWAFTRAIPTTAASLRCVLDLARWLADHALESLQWAASSPFSETARDRTERFKQRVGESLAVAELAGRLASKKDSADAETAYFSGLFHKPEDWFAIASTESPAEALESGRQPPPLPPDERCDAVAEALGVLAGRSPSAEMEPEIAACQRLAAERCQSWAEPVSGVGARLPALTARLARLELLEKSFQETLEHQKLEAMAELAAGAGHEINNPLAIIAGRAQLLLKDEIDPERRRELAVINAQVKRAYEMIADMRLFARPPTPEYQSFDLVPLVDRAIEELAPLAAERATSIVRAGRHGTVAVLADPTQLSVLLHALLRNALEAVGHGGHVAVTLDCDDTTVTIRVSDDGPGIEPEHRQHIFDPFFSARQAGRGLGMGLSKCWRIVTLHGGQIDVESQPGKGAVFTVNVPRRQSQPSGLATPH
jgi:signal transduction histidine kinase